MVSAKKKRKAAMYGISRIDDYANHSHGWRVSLRRGGKVMVRNFPDKKCGSKRKALQQAKQHRNLILAKHPPITRVEFANTLRRNNKSGVPGVCLVTNTYRLANGAKRQLLYWEAIWPTSPGQHLNKRFSVATYGHERAFRLACEARQKGLGQVKGTYWAVRRSLQ